MIRFGGSTSGFVKLAAVLAVVMAAAASARADDIAQLSGEEIERRLSGAVLVGTGPQPPWRQVFFSDGRTIYRDVNKARDSRGEWQIQDDQFCSLWPPSKAWDCYRVAGRNEIIIFQPVDGSDPWPSRITGDSVL